MTKHKINERAKRQLKRNDRNRVKRAGKTTGTIFGIMNEVALNARMSRFSLRRFLRGNK